jgi:hypothetical protein
VNIDQTIQYYKAQLLHYEQRYEQAIRSAHTRMMSVVMSHIQDLLKQLKEKQLEEAFLMHWLYGRLHNIKRIVETQVDQFRDNAKAQVLDAQHVGAILGEGSAIQQIGKVAPDNGIRTIGKSTFDNLIGQTQQGKSISDLMKGFGQEASDRIGKSLVAGASLGQDIAEISRIITSILTTSLNRALIIARTSMMESYRMAFHLTLEVNDIQYWIWVAQPKCCKYCASMDGTQHPMSEQMVSHPNCRCQMQVITE